MANPLIAIVGSADPRRTDYDPPLRNIEDVPTASEQLGRELARAGYRIIVYSSDPAFIEADVVRGYVASQSGQPGSIQIRYPQATGHDGIPQFQEQTTHGKLFDPRPDSREDWEVSFYWSLKDADGIVLLGGGRSALITGLVAQVHRIPLVPIATFGGSAQTVWALCEASGLVTDAERNLMHVPAWSDDCAPKLVSALGDQRERLLRYDAERRRSGQLRQKEVHLRAYLAGGLTLGAVLLTILGMFWPSPEPVLFGACFLGTPLLAGASGGLVRTILDFNRAVTTEPTHSTPVAGVLGMIAGLISAVLFVLAQLATNPEIKNLEKAIGAGLGLLIPFALVIGFIAGLTLESVFGKLRRTDVADVSAVAVK